MKQSEPIFSFKVLRKHTFIDAKYTLDLYDDRFTIYNNPVKAKYEIYLGMSNAQNVIEWSMNTQNEIKGFILQVKGRSKEFLADSKDLAQFKNLLRRRIYFTPIEPFFRIQSIKDASMQRYKVQEIKTGTVFKMRCICKNKDIQSQLINELQCLRILGETIQEPIYEIYKQNDMLFVIYQAIDSISLETLIADGQMDKFQIKIIMKTLLEQIQVIHSHKIMHRNIKPSTILFKDKNNLESLFLSDFQLSMKSDKSQFLYTQCGSPGYVDPDSFRGVFSEKCDVFSAGVTYFKLLTGKDLFSGQNDRQILILNKLGNIDLQFLSLFKLSTDEMNLILKMLEPISSKRISAQEALEFFLHQTIDSSAKKRNFQKVTPNRYAQTTNFTSDSAPTEMTFSPEKHDTKINSTFFKALQQVKGQEGHLRQTCYNLREQFNVELLSMNYIQDELFD